MGQSEPLLLGDKRQWQLQVTPLDPVQELAIAILEQTMRDLGSLAPRVRARARADLRAGSLERWIALACGEDTAAAERLCARLRALAGTGTRGR